MKPLIVANWKMNPQTLAKAQELFGGVAEGIKDVKNAEVVICPPFLYISGLKPTNLNLKLGGQNCFWAESGAYTGEVSPQMLKDLGCEYVILGHSERRRNFGETDEMINRKIKAALEAGLKVILCIGETKEEKNEGKTEEVLKRQLEQGPSEVKKSLIIAYEPVWAIGGGNSCEIECAKEVKNFIESLFPDNPIIYGGSVDSKNAFEYIKKAEFNGLLVGGASLIPEEFIKIVKGIR